MHIYKHLYIYICIIYTYLIIKYTIHNIIINMYIFFCPYG